MTFLRVAEFFQPLFPRDSIGKIDLQRGTEDFVAGVNEVKDFFDVALAADNKDLTLLKVSSVEAASLLQRRLGVRAGPVLVARDGNRPLMLSSVLTSCSLGLGSLMLAWGDRYPPGAGAKNVYDFPGLAGLIRESKKVVQRTGADVKILAPVDLSLLAAPEGVRLARSRLKAGADLLLAQPPSTTLDALEAHDKVLKSTGLKEKVLPGVFPFRSRRDILDCSGKFGWVLPRGLLGIADRGEDALEREARSVARRVEHLGFPGVYVSTRGRPAVLRSVL